MKKKANRQPKPSTPTGCSRRLRPDEIVAIRVWRATGEPKPSYRTIAARYGISCSFVGSVISGEVYRNLPGPITERERMPEKQPEPYELPPEFWRCRGCGTAVPEGEPCTICRLRSHRAGAILAKILAEAFFLDDDAILRQSPHNPYKNDPDTEV